MFCVGGDEVSKLARCDKQKPRPRIETLRCFFESRWNSHQRGGVHEPLLWVGGLCLLVCVVCGVEEVDDGRGGVFIKLSLVRRLLTRPRCVVQFTSLALNRCWGLGLVERLGINSIQVPTSHSPLPPLPATPGVRRECDPVIRRLHGEDQPPHVLSRSCPVVSFRAPAASVTPSTVNENNPLRSAMLRPR
jgi:hypothetical protein